MKKSKKVIVSIISAITIIVVSVSGFFTFWYYHGIITKVYGTWEVEKYGAVDFFPSDYKDFEKVSFKKNDRFILMFSSDAITMKINDPKRFESLKADIIEKYGEKDYFGNEPIEYKSAVFRAVTVGGYGYPKSIGFIGISESKKVIYYLWFYDFDLDVIDDMQEFFIDNFKQTI